MKMKTFAAGAALVLAATAAHASTNLITNGDFSAGLSGWSETNSCCYFTDASGFHEGAIGTNGMLSQTFADTAGETLIVSYDYSANDGSSYQYVTFNGNPVGPDLVGPLAYAHYSYTLGIGTGSDTITFNGRNDPSYNTLANVSVVAVPEPATWALMLVGVGALGGAMRRRGRALAA